MDSYTGRIRAIVAVTALMGVSGSSAIAAPRNTVARAASAVGPSAEATSPAVTPPAVTSPAVTSPVVTSPVVTAPAAIGMWDATVTVDGVNIPFRFEITKGRAAKSGSDGAGIRGSFFDGDRRISSTRGTLEGDALSLTFDQYLATLQATLKDDVLEGRYDRRGIGIFAFKATRAIKAAPGANRAAAPSIAGEWTIPTTSPKGEVAWRFLVRQKGPQISAAILRVDGDTGTLTGSWRDGSYVLSHFSGARPTLLQVTPAADGTLDLLLNGKTRLTGIKAGVAKARNLPAPTDPAQHTKIASRTERFRFSFPDLQGQTVTDADARFHDKVVIVSITGSWCPNCHDEAPFLAQLARTYRKKGLEVVAFSFEEEEQLKDPVRLRTFVADFGIDYTVLLAGEPSQLASAVPQVTNLNAFPTTLFVGRDGTLRATHAGFPSQASGQFHTQAQEEVTALVERLLAERPAARASTSGSR
jgi:thiol-disulfide isomerase/thioredoxin